MDGGGVAAGVCVFISRCGSGGTSLWRGNMGGHPQNGQGPGGGVPVTGEAAFDRSDTAAEGRQ